jgi:hypothetical protein
VIYIAVKKQVKWEKVKEEDEVVVVLRSTPGRWNASPDLVYWKEVKT